MTDERSTWEYRYEVIEAEDLYEKLNYHGSHGWELVGWEPDPKSSQALYIWKRPRRD